MNDLLYLIALTQTENIGPIIAKQLIGYCGGAEAVFKEKPSRLLKIPGIGMQTVSGLKNKDSITKAEKELHFIQKENIKALVQSDSLYPGRLKHFPDSPLVLFFKGEADLNTEHVVSIVGTRNISSYGKHLTEQLIQHLAEFEVLVISGLAYGVDSAAHRVSLLNDIPTVGVLGHGLDRIYPAENKSLAAKMLTKGGLLTEFCSNTKPDRQNFPMRNRIVAGMSDAIVVIETKSGGGSLITAEFGNEYNKDVFAFPGKVGDELSAGCNQLIKNHKAHLIESGEDLTEMLRWEKPGNVRHKQVKKELFVNFTEDEDKVVQMIRSKQKVNIDLLSHCLNFTPSQLANILLNLQFKGVVQEMPGKTYSICI
jgi:DNA processing protein